MAADGIPEYAIKQVGAEIARLRKELKWGRANLVHHILQVLDNLTPDELEKLDINYESISEAWLARLENGRMVKVNREVLEALCQALECTPKERARVLLHADRNILTTTESTPDAVAEVLNFTMARLQKEAGAILATLIGQRRTADLDEQEMLELTAAALEMILKAATS